MSEADFQERIVDYCDVLGLLVFHDNDSRRNRAGFPDLVIVGTMTIFVELKTDKGKMSDKQVEWNERLRASGEKAFLWRPSDWDQIEKALRRLAR